MLLREPATKAWRTPLAGVLALLAHFVFVCLLVRVVSLIGRPGSPAESSVAAALDAPRPAVPSRAPREVPPASDEPASAPASPAKTPKRNSSSHPIDVSCSQHAIGAPVCPKLFIIGCKKCGTTTLFNAIEPHPNLAHVFDARNKRIKEFHFFDQYRPTVDETFRKYISRFPARKSVDDFAIDATPRYMFGPFVPSGLASTRVAPPGSGARFVAVLREPVDRALSDMQWFARRDDMANRDKYNFTTIATQCVRQIKKCRTQALAFSPQQKRQLGWRALPLFHCVRSNQKSIGNGLCSIFSRGMYADQLRRWLAEGYDGRNEMCIFETEQTMTALDVTLKRLQRTCLKDIGIDLRKAWHMLPRSNSDPDEEDQDADEDVGPRLSNAHDYESVDVKWPGARDMLNRELFDELNEDLYRLLRDEFGMDSFRFRRRSG